MAPSTSSASSTLSSFVSSTSTSTSSFPIHTSSFPIHTSSFPIHTSSFPIHTSSFPIHTSSFPIHTTAAPTPASATQAALQRHSGSSKSGKLSPGTAAGIAVAAAIGGALLAFILTCMLMRSRGQKRRETQQHSEKRRSSGGVKALLAKSSDDLLDPKHAWERHLPQPADDNSIRLTIKTLLHQIELHVENFYTDSAASSNVSEEVRTELLKLDSPFLPKSLAVLIPQARVKTTLIKHCLAHLIVSNITTEGTQTPTSQSFLPLEFVALPHALDRTRSDPSSKPAFSQSLSRWRVLTAYLRPAPATDPTYTTARDAATTAAATAFCTAFAPWAARPQDRAARFQSLVTIMQGAADAGVLVFAQPAAFSWIWDVGGGNVASAAREIVVTPGFVKVADDEAKKLARPQVMVQQVVHTF